jgi:transcriptional regulator GlxA family with amidase domain
VKGIADGRAGAQDDRMAAGAGERRIVVLAYDGVQSLDVVGPVEVFSVATQHRIVRPYRVEVVGPTGAPITTTSGIVLQPAGALADGRGPVDTLVVAGGEGVHAQRRDPAVVAGVRALAGRARRVVSVCTGTFLLAEAGLLDGRRVTTHWGWCRHLAREFPTLTVESEPIFVQDGDVYTSAGVTAGIDLCLALVEADHGRELALSVARQLVVFLKRPGGQAQFSSHLSAQLAERDAVAEVQTWIADHLDEDLSVARLAARAAMSPRHFARVFRADTGVTPARFVERARVEQARTRLEQSSVGVEEIAHACGFGTPETMRRAFLRALWVAPSEYRQRFRAAARPAGPTPRAEVS